MSRGRALLALSLLAALQQSARAAPADAGAAGDTRAVFEAAAERMGSDPAGAAAAFEALAERDPDGEYAPDALLEAAELAEERLGKPDRALALYQRLLDRHPNSRLSLRARARRDFLAANLRGGVAPLAEYQEILLHYASRPPEESEARMRRLVEKHPDFPLADRAAMWLARSAAQAGRPDEAERRYLEVERRWAGTEAAFEAMRGRAEVLLAGGHALRARRVYAELARVSDRTAAESAARGLRAADRALAAFAVLVLALVYLALFLGLQGMTARRELGRLPFELKFYLPVALVFTLAATGTQAHMLLAVALIALGGALVIWFAGAAGRRRLARGPLPPLAQALHLAATALAVLAVAYGAVYVTRLGGFLVETVRYGAER